MTSEQEIAQAQSHVLEAEARGFIEIIAGRAIYHLNNDQEYSWNDPEEPVRYMLVAYLIIECGYPPHRLKLEVPVPRRTPNDFADIVVFSDDSCKSPYIVAETKARDLGLKAMKQAVEQAIGNAHGLRAPFTIVFDYDSEYCFDTSGAFPAMERERNRRGQLNTVPCQYMDHEPMFRFVAGSSDDIEPTTPSDLARRVRKTHSIIWSGGKRDPLTSFDEWSKVLFAKVHDERSTKNGTPRKFQVGPRETATTVANRVHGLFGRAAENDRTIFPAGIRITLPDSKLYEIVETLQDISITDANTDTIGTAFESFFGSVFRGELGQYFTMRELARFTVASLDISDEDYIIDPTAGSGGFLLETLLQVWHRIANEYTGQPEIERKRYDFAHLHVFGVEIHEILGRILKINLLLHHDGHTNVESDRSCLDVDFDNPRLRDHWKGGFTRIVGNPPFGDKVKANDSDLLGENTLEAFTLAESKAQIASEHLIIERAVDMLDFGGKLGLVIPDGILNNPGKQSGCPAVRELLVRSGVIEMIVSLPDHAFRKSGAQNKTSIIVFRKFEEAEQATFNAAYKAAPKGNGIEAGLRAIDSYVFFAEANKIGYNARGVKIRANDLYDANSDGSVSVAQNESILAEFERFKRDPKTYRGHLKPDCTAASMVDVWKSHTSHRLDPKFHLFKSIQRIELREGWESHKLGSIMERRLEIARPEDRPDDEVHVLTLSQTGEISFREAGKGQAPPEWLGMYFEDMPTTWYTVRNGDLVYSSIDLWKGCAAVARPEHDQSIVSNEFPVYRVSERIDPDFLAILLRSRYYQRAFRAITTGHSNRRRTQAIDFENLEIVFPTSLVEQRQLVSRVLEESNAVRIHRDYHHHSMIHFSDLIDGRGDEHLSEVAIEH